MMCEETGNLKKKKGTAIVTDFGVKLVGFESWL